MYYESPQAFGFLNKIWTSDWKQEYQNSTEIVIDTSICFFSPVVLSKLLTLSY